VKDEPLFVSAVSPALLLLHVQDRNTKI